LITGAVVFSGRCKASDSGVLGVLDVPGHAFDPCVLALRAFRGQRVSLQSTMTAWASEPARRVRAHVFATFAAEGRAPSPAELAAALELAAEQVAGALRELHAAHALVLTEAGDAIRMAHPFSAAPMNFAVRDGARFWWGGCAWDSFGIMAALGRPLEVTTACPSCGATLRYSAPPDAPPELVVRLPRPAAEWWKDVVATCSDIRAFCNAQHVDEWLARKPGTPAGATVAAEQLYRLALPWYGDRLDPHWEPQTQEHRQRLLEQTGLSGDFWRLPGSPD
jgi:hypothetical protein